MQQASAGSGKRLSFPGEGSEGVAPFVGPRARVPRQQEAGSSRGLGGKGAGLQGAEAVRTLSAGERLARVCCAGTSLPGASSQVPEAAPLRLRQRSSQGDSLGLALGDPTGDSRVIQALKAAWQRCFSASWAAARW